MIWGVSGMAERVWDMDGWDWFPLFRWSVEECQGLFFRSEALAGPGVTAIDGIEDDDRRELLKRV